MPYPGAPLSSDQRVMSGTADDRALMTLKGALESMGVLETDEGLREGDLEELAVLWDKLKSLGERAKQNG